ncbi:MAG: mechanosensitive ion channel [Alteromonadaceae bacterium]|nr:mechanosensitive ion channel [Alteromonadaceae bacterium]
MNDSASFHFGIWVLNLLAQKGVEVAQENIWFAIASSLVVVLLSWVGFKVAQHVLSTKVIRIILATKNKWDDALEQHGFFKRIAHVVPAVLIHLLTPLFLFEQDALLVGLQKFAVIYLIFTVTWSISAIFNTLQDVYNETRYAKRVPITGFVQVGKLFVTVIAVLLVIAELLNKSPLILLSGLGAVTAVIILVFRDTILGFVAGINIVANRTVNNGDWIEMPKYGADGTVLAVGLTTVKVRNWDNTISTIPTYALMSDSMKNWRGMEESGGRRIKRAIHIDVNSIKFCSEDMLGKLAQLELLNDYVTNKRAEIKAQHEALKNQQLADVNQRQLTNVGTYRIYLERYLKSHPMINQNLTLLVRQLAPTEKGLPIELYAFSSDKAWANYEAIQADIFDHALAIMPLFELNAYQAISDAQFCRK